MTTTHKIQLGFSLGSYDVPYYACDRCYVKYEEVYDPEQIAPPHSYPVTTEKLYRVGDLHPFNWEYYVPVLAKLPLTKALVYLNTLVCGACRLGRPCV